MSEWSFKAHIGNEKNSLLTANMAHIIDTQNTLSTMSLMYIEKNVSAPSPRQNTNKNKENDIILIEMGIEKKSFLITWKIPFLLVCSMFFNWVTIQKITHKII